MKKTLTAFATILIAAFTSVGTIQAAEVSIGGVVEMFLYLDQDNNPDSDVDNGDVELRLEASEQAGYQTGYVRFLIESDSDDDGMNDSADILSMGKATAGVKGGWGDLSIGTTTDLSAWGQYGEDIIDDVSHEFDRDSLGYIRDFGGIKLGLGYTPGGNGFGDTDSIVGVGIEFDTGAFSLGLNTQDATTTIGIKGLFGSIGYGLHYIDVDGVQDEIVGIRFFGKSGDIDITLSMNAQGDDDKTRLELAYPVAGALIGTGRFQDDYSRIGLSMEF